MEKLISIMKSTCILIIKTGKHRQLERGIQKVLEWIEKKKPRFPSRPDSRDLRPPRQEGRIRDF